jgi:hypothetical protein
MNAKMEQVFAGFLTEFGALAPVRLGNASRTAPTRDDVNRFLESIEFCKASTKLAAAVLFGAYLALLLGVLVLMFMSQWTSSSTTLVAILGTSGVAGLAIIPMRMQLLWKDLAVMQLTLAILPGQSPQDQLDLIKSLHVASKSAAGS